MAALTFQQWMLIALGVAAWIIPAVRIARMARQYGRSPRRWFFITLFASAIPATIVFWRDYQKQMRAADVIPGFGGCPTDTDAAEHSDDEPDEQARCSGRCHHCGSPLPPEQTAGESVCPTCRMTRQEKHLA
jgi:hypothetical protein